MAQSINSTDLSQEPRKRKRKPNRPEKPRDDFPLFPHANGCWAKKIRGELHHFGSWREDPTGEAALTKYLDQKDALHAGRKPRPQTEEMTVRDLVNRFLTAKRHLLDTHELGARTFADYYATCERVIGVLGTGRVLEDLGPDDFDRLRKDLAKRWGPTKLGNVIQMIRSLFKFGLESGLIIRPVLYGPTFKRPSKKVLRLERIKKGPQMFEADEIRKMLGKAGLQLRAMILLGINCGLGNTDCASLCVGHLDLKGGWLKYPRPKTGIDRRSKLWPQTLEAIKEVLAKRRTPADKADADLVFLTQRGFRWTKVRMTEEKDERDGASKDLKKIKLFNDDAISKETKKILQELNINGRRNFYALRHTFQTIADNSRDQVAVDHVMGHAPDDMASVYRERISDDRLVAVADHVRRWLFNNKPARKLPRSKVSGDVARKRTKAQRPRLTLVRAEAAG